MDFSQIFQNPTLVWFLAGLILLLLEFAIPGVFILFFGLGAWLTSIACAAFDLDVNGQLLVFLISSVAMLVFLRKHIKRKFFDKPMHNEASLDEEFIGKTAIVNTSIDPNHPGQISFKGTTWKATSDAHIDEGAAVEITGKESITLTVKPK